MAKRLGESEELKIKKDVKVTVDKYTKETVWESPSAIPKKSHDCTIPKSITDVMLSLNLLFPNLEYSIYTHIDWNEDEQIFELDTDYYIPKQEVTAVHIDYEEENIDERWNCVIHKHPKGIKTFSSTDDTFINSNFFASLLWESERFVDGIVNLKTEYGRIQIPLNGIMHDPFEYMDQTLLKQARERIKTKPTPVKPLNQYAVPGGRRIIDINGNEYWDGWDELPLEQSTIPKTTERSPDANKIGEYDCSPHTEYLKDQLETILNDQLVNIDPTIDQDVVITNATYFTLQNFNFDRVDINKAMEDNLYHFLNSKLVGYDVHLVEPTMDLIITVPNGRNTNVVLQWVHAWRKLCGVPGCTIFALTEAKDGSCKLAFKDLKKIRDHITEGYKTYLRDFGKVIRDEQYKKEVNNLIDGEFGDDLINETSIPRQVFH